MTLALGLLSLCPRVRKEAGTLVLSTGFKTSLLTLGLARRRVVVDPAARTVTIESRYGWVVERERVVPFDRVRAVSYGYDDLSPDGPFSLAHDAVDVYRVGLRLWDDEDVPLFRFVGEGSWVNDSDWPDWLYWDEKYGDLAGTQDRDALAVVELLTAMIGVGVRPPK